MSGESRKRSADEMEAECSQEKDPWTTASFEWRIENFSQLSCEPVRSECFEAGIATWRLIVYPDGHGSDTGVYLTVFLEAQDTMWEPTAGYKVTVVNQAGRQQDSSPTSLDAKKSLFFSGTDTFDSLHSDWGVSEFIKLSSLRDAAAGWLVNDTLVLKVDVIVEREDRFEVDTGGMPCDMALQLPAGWQVPALCNALQLASPFFRGALDDVKGSALIPVDGSLGVWTYILTDLHHQRDPPALTLGSGYALLPVVHKYHFSKLLTRLMAFVMDMNDALNHRPKHPNTYVVNWLALAERLLLDVLRKLCLNRLGRMTKKQLQVAIRVEVVGVGAAAGGRMRKKYAVRQEVAALGEEVRNAILLLTVSDGDA
ncbi:hypothetical protein FOA52_013289 [Chlamydomonas sp. UWO 241]|nr:hypothetical protein FOA52_013289 [Chlamydomonas sp. UWO 241]